MEVADFPSQEVIDEFKQKPVAMNHLNLKWKQPDMVKFLVSHQTSFLWYFIVLTVVLSSYSQRMMSALLQWQEIYCFQKLLPLLTRWQLFHYGSGDQNLPLRGIVWPDFIKKKRAPKGKKQTFLNIENSKVAHRSVYFHFRHRQL